MNPLSPRAFTLMELLITIIIIGILASIAIPMMSGSIENAKGINAAANLRIMSTSARMYYNEAGNIDASYSTLTEINNTYGLSVSDNDFGYNGSQNNATYYFQATRSVGTYQGNYIFIDNSGNLNYDSWPWKH